MNLIFTSLMVLIAASLISALRRRSSPDLSIPMGALIFSSILCLLAALRAIGSSEVAPLATLPWPMPLGIAAFRLDGLSAWFLATIAILTLSVAIYSIAYMRSEGRHGSLAAYGSFMCLLQVALVLVVTAADAVVFLIGWEMMTLSAFFLVSFRHREKEVRRAGWMYLVATHLGTALFVLPLFAVLAARSGGVSFDGFHLPAARLGGDACTVLFLLALIGFGTKAGFMPMHVWLPVAHPAAPTPVSALLSGVVIKTGIYGLLRVLSWLPIIPSHCAAIMLVFGMVSGVLGVLYALAQHDLKRLLAYHSVENIGIIGLGVGMGMLGQAHGQPLITALGYGGALLHVLNHALFKGLLFLSAGAVIHGAGTGEIDKLGGLARKMPINAILFLIAAISICGLPPFNGFVSEWLLYGSMFAGSARAAGLAAGWPVLGIVSLTLMGGLALACFAKVSGVVFLGEPRHPFGEVHRTPMLMCAGMALLAVLCMGIGLLPALVLPMTHSAVGVVSGLRGGDLGAMMGEVIAPAWRLSGAAAILLIALALLIIARRRWMGKCAPGPVPAGATWGCGYAAPTPRMQYTASSFAWPLVQSFRGVLWPFRHLVQPAGPFAGAAHIETHTLDMAEHDFFAPLFRAIGRALSMIRRLSWRGESAAAMPDDLEPARGRPLRLVVSSACDAIRRGKLHAGIAFIVITLLIIFAVESLRGPMQPAHDPGPSARAVQGVAQ